MSVKVGIDFGTTNSLVACVPARDPVIVPDRHGGRVTPSVVGFSPSGVVVGSAARNQALANPEGTVFLVKRALGETETIMAGGREMRTVEIASLLFRELKARADDYLGENATSAVLTVPARFSGRRREAVLEAATLGGFRDLRLLNEPTAAALAHAKAASELSPSSRERICVVYDFGGGTFDVTVLSHAGTAYRVLASDGDERLGGADVDAALSKRLNDGFIERHGVDATSDPTLARMLADQAERAKMDLSAAAVARFAIPFALTGGRFAHLEAEVSRDELEELASPVVERTLALVRAALDAAGVDQGKVDSLVLSGGMSRMPLVRRSLERRFGWKIAPMVDPEEIVAAGAALFASSLGGPAAVRAGSSVELGPREEGCVLDVVDVASEAWGIELSDGSVGVVVPRGEALPVSRSRVFTTVEDGQESVELHVVQGSAADAESCVSLGRFSLGGIRPAPRGAPEIIVTFTIDESDLLSIVARERLGGAERRMTLERESSVARSEESERVAIGLLVSRVEESIERARVEASFREEIDEALSGARAVLDGKGGDVRSVARALRSVVAELECRLPGGDE